MKIFLVNQYASLTHGPIPALYGHASLVDQHLVSTPVDKYREVVDECHGFIMDREERGYGPRYVLTLANRRNFVREGLDGAALIGELQPICNRHSAHGRFPYFKSSEGVNRESQERLRSAWREILTDDQT